MEITNLLIAWKLAGGSGGGSSVTVESLGVTENGTYTAPTGKAYSPVTVNVSGGGGGVAAKDVNFIDYDGTILHAYTAQEFTALDSMPANPSHDGLTAQGWNWELAAAKTYVATYGKLWIGQMYVTTSGATEIDIELSDLRKSPYLGIGINGTVSIDWGDGSTADTVTGTKVSTVKYTQHNYATCGRYTIKITPAEGTSIKISGTGNSGSNLLWGASGSSTTNVNRLYQEAILSVKIGAGMTDVGSYAFYNCYALDSITIPSGVTSIGENAFRYCSHLTSVTIPSNVTSISSTTFQNCDVLASVAIPSGVTSIENNTFYTCSHLTSVTIPSNVTSISSGAFQACKLLTYVAIPSSVTSIGGSTFASCQALTSVTIPSSVTSIGNSAFQNCYALTSITIPSSVTSIGTSAFDSCYSLKEIHLLPSTPPTLTNSNTFGNTRSDLVFYVPVGRLNDYKTATIWATWADQMQEEPS